MTDLAVIGGTGFDRLDGFTLERRETVTTPYGEPSAALVFGSLGGVPLVFLPRHGDAHTIAPHRINYRANVRALKNAGVKKIVALAAVGGIAGDLCAGEIVIPDQIVDYTWGRAHTFFDGADDGVTHIEFADPFDDALRAAVLNAAAAADVRVTDGAVCAVTQGPRIETAAEIDRLERDGAGVVGMTTMPEAALAREAEIQYAVIAMVVNPAAGRGDAINDAMIADNLKTTVAKAVAIIRRL